MAVYLGLGWEEDLKVLTDKSNVHSDRCTTLTPCTGTLTGCCRMKVMSWFKFKLFKNNYFSNTLLFENLKILVAEISTFRFQDTCSLFPILLFLTSYSCWKSCSFCSIMNSFLWLWKYSNYIYYKHRLLGFIFKMCVTPLEILTTDSIFKSMFEPPDVQLKLCNF